MASTDLAEKNYFTLERQRELNGEGYNPRDVRTYKVPPLKNSPAGDICVHCSMPDSYPNKASSVVRTNIGSFHGNYHDKSDSQANNRVLHFPLASSFSTLMLLNKKRLTTLYPSWMIERYGLENLHEDLTHTQTTPIFVDQKTSKFVVLMDESFLDKVSYSDLTVGLTREEEAYVTRYSDKDGKRKFFGFKVDCYQDFFDYKNGLRAVRDKVFANYLSLFVTAQNTQKMLAVWMLNKQADTRDPFYSQNHSVSQLMSGLIADQSLSINLSFSVVAKRDKTFYPMKDDGTIETKCPFYFQRKHNKYGDNFGDSLGGYLTEAEKDGTTTLLLPYTEEDHELLKHIVERLDLLRNELMRFFKRSEQGKEHLTDMSLQDVIEDFSASPALLPFVGGKDGVS
jgi:hypothetical protein